MTDQTVPADDVREIIGKMHYHANHDNVRGTEEEYVRFFASQLEALLPTPTTLADMTREERAECRWMQADVKGRSMRYVIATPSDRNGLAGLVSADGGIEWTYPERITPRPDLPRMEWPSVKKPAPALPDDWRVADHKDNGRVIVTNTTPNRDGYVCYVLPADDYALGYDWLLCKPYELTYLDTDDTERNQND